MVVCVRVLCYLCVRCCLLLLYVVVVYCISLLCLVALGAGVGSRLSIVPDWF